MPYIEGNDTPNTLTGTPGDDFIRGFGGDDTLNGGRGTNRLWGEAGNDTLINTQGIALLQGGMGNDIYSVSTGPGVSTRIIEQTGTDILQIRDVGVTDLSIFRLGDDLVIDRVDKDSRILIIDYYTDPDNRVEYLQTSEGFWHIYDSDANNDPAQPQIFFGTAGNDTLNNSQFSAALFGGMGDDTYSVSTASGASVEIIERSGTDTLQITDAAMADLSIYREGFDLIIDRADTGSRILITDYYYGDPEERGKRVEYLETTDGLWHIYNWNDRYSDENYAGNQLFVDSEHSNSFRTEWRNTFSHSSVVMMSAGNDRIRSEAQYRDVQIFGGEGNDEIDVTGINSLYDGGPGDDTYTFSIGTNISAFNSDIRETGGGVDLMEFDDDSGDAPTFVDLSQFEFRRSGDHLVIDNLATLSGRFRIVVRDQYSDDPATFVEQFRWTIPAQSFTDFAFQQGLTGTDGNDIITGTLVDEVLEGGAGRDILSGAGGDDTIRGGEGDDIVNGGAGRDMLYGGAGADVFSFLRVFSDSSADASSRDTIMDFSQAEGDLIVLSGHNRTDTTFIGQDAFEIEASGPDDPAAYAPQVRYEHNGGNTLVEMDIDPYYGNGPEFSILLAGIHHLTEDDFAFL